MSVGNSKPTGIEVSEVQSRQQLYRKWLPADVMTVGKSKPTGIDASEAQPRQQLDRK
jgi:hypothetical protein